MVLAVARLWDDSLYAGSAEFYLTVDCPTRSGWRTRSVTSWVWTGRVGCSTLAAARGRCPYFASLFDDVLAVDADADMIRVGEVAARSAGISNVTWRHEYAEDLHDVGRFRVVTVAQSFHWMDRPVVADKIRRWLQPDGYCVHVGATTHEGTGATGDLPYPAPPRDCIRELVQAYLGADRRAGQGIVVGGYTPGDEEAVCSGPPASRVHR
jgi:SAM-dependent methyltransferase